MAIPQATVDFETEGSLSEVEDIQMTIAEDGMEFLMSILTRMYEDPTLAVVREYSTNAADAHIEAGYDGPVEITLPSAFQKNFVVRDYGPGMDLEDIRNTYSKYVASTKRQSNTQAGMFGIGSKSALALGDTFTVESVKDGKKIIVAVMREGRGKASMKVIQHSQPTDDPDGTTIKVPAKNPHLFERAAKSFYKYVKKGVFEVNGNEWGEDFGGVKVDDDTYALSDQYYNTDTVIVMGNVPYTVNTGRRVGVVKYVPPGTFEPTPPREGLEQTEGFNERISKYITEAGKGVAEAATDTIKDMSVQEAGEWLLANQVTLSNWEVFDDVEYDGKRMGSKYKPSGCIRVQGSGTYEANPECKFHTYFLGAHVVEWDGKSKSDVNDYATKKAWGTRSMHNYPNGVFLYYKDKKPEYALSERTTTWERARQTNTYGGTSRRFGSNVHKAGDDWKVPTKKAHHVYEGTPAFPKRATKVVPYAEWKGDDDDRTLVFFSPTDLEERSHVDLINSLMENDDVFLVIKYTNQFDKTKRENPEAVYYKDYGKDYAAQLIAKYGEAPFASVAGKGKQFYIKLKGDLFDKMRRIESKIKNAPKVSSDDSAAVRGFGKSLLTIESEYDTLVSEVEERYPLLPELDYRPKLAPIQEYIKMMDDNRKDK